MSDVKVSRAGIVSQGERRLGWVDRYRQTSGRWRAVTGNGRERGQFPTRAAAIAWLCGDGS